MMLPALNFEKSRTASSAGTPTLFAMAITSTRPAVSTKSIELPKIL